MIIDMYDNYSFSGALVVNVLMMVPHLLMETGELGQITVIVQKIVILVWHTNQGSVIIQG